MLKKLSVSLEIGEVTEDDYAARITIVGFPDAEIADRFSDLLYELVCNHLEAMVTKAAPGSEYLGDAHPGSEAMN